MKNNIGCWLFKMHNYKNILENKKYVVKQCEICKNYIVTYKEYNIKSRFRHDELPINITSKINCKCQA